MKRAIFLLLAAVLAALSFASTSWASTEADKLFQQAIAADQAGDVAQRDFLLSDTLKADPDHHLAHWYSGDVLHNGKWQSLGMIERTVSTDPRWQEYQDLVETSEDTLADHAAMARWCRTKGMQLEEKRHWLHVLRHDSANREALGALGLRLFRGGYATPKQIALVEVEEKKAKVAFKHYSELLKTAMRDAERTDGAERSTALKKISEVVDPLAIRSIVEVVMADAKNEKRILEKLGNDKGEALLREMHLAGIAALASMPDHEATQSLLDISLYSSDKDVRAAAARKLKSREPTSFMPQLMAGLSAPVELEVSFHTLPNGQITVYEDFTEKGPLATKKHSRSSSFLTQHVNYHTHQGINRATSTRISAVWSDQWRDMASAAAQVASTQDQVELENAIRKERNARIERVLELAADKQLGEDPEAWWNDWQSYNELYTPEFLPVSQTQEYYDFSQYVPHFTSSATSRVPERPYVKPTLRPEEMPYGKAVSLYREPVSYYREPRSISCFAAGTPVWTQAGPVAIEKIKLGELLLSQNPVTGELNYRPVVDVTVRPPSRTIKLGINDETIVSTRGHRFWVSGKGWQMAKFLEVGDSLATVFGSAEIQVSDEAEDAEAYNLEVGEFHTFFVGNSRLLVHDNTCPEQTINILPGVSPREALALRQLTLRN